jgi:hypothetical protein
MSKVFRWIGGVFFFFSTLWFIMATPLLAEDMAHQRIVADGWHNDGGDFHEFVQYRGVDRR